MKRIISVLLVALIIISVLSVSVFNTAAASLVLDTPMKINYSGHGTMLSFKPTESGYYLLEPDTDTLDTYAILLDKSLTELYSSDDENGTVAFSLLCYLEADIKYYYRVGIRQEGASVNVTLKKAEKIELPDVSTLDSLSLDTQVSVEKDSTAYYSFTPKVNGNYTISSDSDAEFVVYDDNSIDIAQKEKSLTQLFVANKTYIIAVSGACVFKITKTEQTAQLTLNEKKQTAITSDIAFVLYSFTPQADNVYKFESIGEAADPVLRLYDSMYTELIFDDDSSEGNNACFKYFLKAGQTYYCEVSNAHLGNMDTFDVLVSCADIVKGDSDMDGTLTVLDATNIQLYLVKLVSLTDEAEFLSNVDGDDKLTVLDATRIQLFLASYIEEL